MRLVCPALILLVTALPLRAPASEIALGEQRLEVPAPAGFSATSASDRSIFAAEVEPQNELLAAFVPSDRTGQDDLPTRHFSVQADRNLTPISMTITDFEDLKTFVAERNQDFVARADADYAGLRQELEATAGLPSGVAIAIERLGTFPFPAHDATDRMLAYSYLILRDASGGDESSALQAETVTVTLLHVQGKVLILYAHDRGNSLDWTRSASAEWANAILSMNADGTGAAGVTDGEIESPAPFERRRLEVDENSLAPSRDSSSPSNPWRWMGRLAVPAALALGFAVWAASRRRAG